MSSDSSYPTVNFFGVSIGKDYIDYSVNKNAEPHIAGRKSPFGSAIHGIVYEAKSLGLKVYIMNDHSRQGQITKLCMALDEEELPYEVVPIWIGRPEYMAALHGYLYDSSPTTIREDESE